jgi:anhydro-N-acetylmuramic acid kinase
MQKYRAIGLMSGTSLDGLDLAACEFSHDKGKWQFGIAEGHTIPYSQEWRERLIKLPSADALSFSYTHVEYGHLLGRLTKEFIDQTNFRPDIIASHGHTIFHQPDKGLTVQIGAGSAIAVETGFPVICDFRSADVALGGQGAPLVPVGDRLLFPGYDACLNLGGFANISMESASGRIAFDICPVNIVLNILAEKMGKSFDRDGETARTGEIDPELLEELNALGFYRKKHPKSLGREWLEQDFLPSVNISDRPVNDLMRTICEHIAIQVNNALKDKSASRVLVTGGGAYHKFLVERIQVHGPHCWSIPGDDLVNYKEALVFALLGLLRWRGEVNILGTVTGCRENHSGGAVYKTSGL